MRCRRAGSPFWACACRKLRASRASMSTWACPRASPRIIAWLRVNSERRASGWPCSMSRATLGSILASVIRTTVPARHAWIGLRLLWHRPVGRRAGGDGPTVPAVWVPVMELASALTCSGCSGGVCITFGIGRQAGQFAA